VNHEASPLDDVARALLTHWALDENTPIELLNISENTTFGIGKDLILRIHRAGYSSFSEITSELDWLRAVRRDAGISTPVVVPTMLGEDIVCTQIESLDEERHAVMFTRLPGVEPMADSLDSLFEPLGALTARLHQHAQHWPRPSGFDRRVWDIDRSLGTNGHWGDWRYGLGVGAPERAILDRLATSITHRLHAYGTGPDRFGLIHADLRLANLLVDGADSARSGGGGGGATEISVIDFDDSGFSWFGYDLGASFSFIEDHPNRAALIDSWCCGYRSIAPLDRATTDELMTFILLRRLILTAWFGTHSDIDLAHTIGRTFARGTCELAEAFLTSDG
jgi:Ser/Thr protein kinase RdoA (MazF antagonist)